ncbi:unnamed protein product, partial [Pylaiella littoralis]
GPRHQPRCDTTSGNLSVAPPPPLKPSAAPRGTETTAMAKTTEDSAATSTDTTAAAEETKPALASQSGKSPSSDSEGVLTHISTAAKSNRGGGGGENDADSMVAIGMEQGQREKKPSPEISEGLVSPDKIDDGRDTGTANGNSGKYGDKNDDNRNH